MRSFLHLHQAPRSFAFVSTAFVVLGLLGIVPEIAACTTTSCTQELRFYTVTLSRSIPNSTLALAQSTAEVCVSERCSVMAVRADGTFGEATDPTRKISGAIVKDQLNVQVSLPEDRPSSRVSVAVRIRNSSRQVFFEATSNVAFDDDECHPAPVTTSL
jgi:hypothetical protein